MTDLTPERLEEIRKWAHRHPTPDQRMATDLLAALDAERARADGIADVHRDLMRAATARLANLEAVAEAARTYVERYGGEPFSESGKALRAALAVLEEPQ